MNRNMMKILFPVLLLVSLPLLAETSSSDKAAISKEVTEKLNAAHPVKNNAENRLNDRHSNTAPPVALTNIKVSIAREPEIDSIIRKYNKTEKGKRYLQKEYRVKQRLKGSQYLNKKSVFVKIEFYSFQSIVLSAKRQVYLVAGNQRQLGYSGFRYGSIGLPERISRNKSYPLSRTKPQTRLFILNKKQIRQAAIEFDGQRYPLGDYIK